MYLDMRKNLRQTFLQFYTGHTEGEARLALIISTSLRFKQS